MVSERKREIKDTIKWEVMMITSKPAKRQSDKFLFPFPNVYFTFVLAIKKIKKNWESKTENLSRSEEDQM